ncbi:MAG: hypothetical protein ACHQ16_00715, partial [Candidatus Lutacidiplasmatales archaeon]
MATTPMTDGATPSIRTTPRPFRAIRFAAFAAVAIALLMALPLPALASSSGLPAVAGAPTGTSIALPTGAASAP